jgi:hypothetical protein
MSMMGRINCEIGARMNRKPIKNLNRDQSKIELEKNKIK